MATAGNLVKASDIHTVVGNVSIIGNLTVSGVGQVTFARKTGNSSYTSTTTLVADTELTMELAANAEYFVQFYLMMTGTDGDIRTDWTTPASSTSLKGCVGPSAATELQDDEDTNMRTAVHATTAAIGYGLNSATAFTGAWEWGYVVTTVAGTLAIRHSQETNTANASQVRAGSLMVVRRVA